MQKNNSKLFKGKMQLLLSDPFFATLMMSMRVEESETVKKAMVDGERIFFNPEHLEALTVDEVKAEICSGILKVANCHHLRRNGKDAEYWNRASEIVTNQIVKDAGMKLPKDALTDDQYKGQSIEQVFTSLYGNKPDNQPQNNAGGNGNSNKNGQQQQQGNDGQPSPVNVEVNDSPTAKTEVEKSKEQTEIKQKIAQAAMIGRKAGKMPGGLEELIHALLNPKVNWHEVLARFVVDIAKNDYSFKRPNPRFIHSGFYLPTLYNVEIGKIAFFIDVSVSVDIDLCKQFWGELVTAAQQINAPILALFIDTVVRDTQEVDPNEQPAEFKIFRGGGTDFAPGFNYLIENNIECKAIIYLTDGECDSFADEPDCPVLWVKYGSYKFNPPYGEVIEVE